MGVAVPKKKSRTGNHPLRKRFITRHNGYAVYTVNASAVRNIAQPDEEFTNFATQNDFPDLIPKGEIWISDKSLDTEGVFFIVNALTSLKLVENGMDEEKAYQTGLQLERDLREPMTGLKFRDGKPQKEIPKELYAQEYLTLPDHQFPIHAWLVDGKIVRSLYKTDYTEGGHGYVYPWVPKDQIWIEKDLEHWEMPFILSHEYLELRLMRDVGMEYDPAHELCSKVEFDLRKGKGPKTLIRSGRRRLTKRDLPHVTREEVFQFVLENYLKSEGA